MPSTHDHSSGARSVSSAGSRPPESAGKLDLLDALIAQSEQAAERLLADHDGPAYQAALHDLAEQSSRAAHELLDLERASSGPPSLRRTQ